MISEQTLRDLLSQTKDDGTPRFTSDEVLNTLTAFLLALIVEAGLDLKKLGQSEAEMIGLALNHAGLSPDMSQDEFNAGMLRFMAVNPPNEELMRELAGMGEADAPGS